MAARRSRVILFSICGAVMLMEPCITRNGSSLSCQCTHGGAGGEAEHLEIQESRSQRRIRIESNPFACALVSSWARYTPNLGAIGGVFRIATPSSASHYSSQFFLCFFFPLDTNRGTYEQDMSNTFQHTKFVGTTLYVLPSVM